MRIPVNDERSIFVFKYLSTLFFVGLLRKLTSGVCDCCEIVFSMLWWSIDNCVDFLIFFCSFGFISFGDTLILTRIIFVGFNKLGFDCVRFFDIFLLLGIIDIDLVLFDFMCVISLWIMLDSERVKTESILIYPYRTRVN